MVSFLFIPLVIFFFLLSAFFSSAETAVYSIDEIKFKKIRDTTTRRIVRGFIKNSSLFLLGILLGNTLANILVASSLERILDIRKPIFLTLVITALILIFGEIIPKFFAMYFPVRVVSIYSRILNVFFIALRPFLSWVNLLLLKLVDRISKKKKDRELRSAGISALQSIISREGIFESQEKEIIENILTFVRREVWNIMTPRNKLFSIEKNTEVKEVLKKLKKKRFSKIPVYDGTDNNIVGYVETRDLLLLSFEEKDKNTTVENLMKPMYFVPETKKLPEMLEDFEKKGIKIATVVDGYGSAVGIVTLSDILGEILGEFIDESFNIEGKIVEISDGKFLVTGDLSIDDFNEYFHLNIEKGDYETLAGFVINYFGNIPREGDFIVVEDKKITVRKKKQTHIEQLLVEKI